MFDQFWRKGKKYIFLNVCHFQISGTHTIIHLHFQKSYRAIQVVVCCELYIEMESASHRDKPISCLVIPSGEVKLVLGYLCLYYHMQPVDFHPVTFSEISLFCVYKMA